MMYGQTASTASTSTPSTSTPAVTGVPEDWTHHHVVFSNPGTLADAEKNGTVDQWFKITSDARYQIAAIEAE